MSQLDASAPRVERELRFGEDDMKLFALASGDHSPLHTDPEFGRRTAFGQCIVYGGLETLALLGLLPQEVQRRLRTVRSLFPGAVFPRTAYGASAVRRPGDAERWELQLTGRGKVLARVSASSEPERPRGVDPTALRGGVGPPPPPREHPLEAGFELAGSYRPGPELAALAQGFGAGAIPAALLEGIGWASHTVGMSIPAFDGLCAGVTVVAEPDSGSAPAGVPAPAGPDGLAQCMRIREYDARTDRVVIDGVLSDGTGGLRCLAVIECFPFSPTPLTAAAAPGSGPALERGSVLVVGGSRGAGGALALALLDRGYSVHVVYRECDRAAGELRRLAGPRADALVFHVLDAGAPDAVGALARAIGDDLDGLVLCAAPPPLPMALTAATALELGDYVAASLRLVATPVAELARRLRPDRGWVMFFSAAAVADPDRDLPQLTAAKAAVEGLAATVAASHPSLSVLVARVPKMRTDLVNTPGARLRAAPPEVVARQLADLVSDGDLAPGVTVVNPTGAAVLVP